MGAFGELLIEYWGGDIKSYRGERNITPKIKTPDQIEEENTERDEDLFEQIKQVSENTREKLSRIIKQLKEDELAERFKTKKYKSKYEKWNKSFLEETLKIFKVN